MEGDSQASGGAVMASPRAGKRPWWALAGAMIAVVGLAATFGSPSGASASSTHDDWKMFHHDGQHSGLSPDTVIGASTAPGLTEAWAQLVGGGSQGKASVEASPAVVFNIQLNKTIVYEGSTQGVVHAFDALTGATVWMTSIGGGVVASPAVDGNTVYIAAGNGTLWALNAATGAVECSFTLPIVPPETAPGHIQSSPVVGHLHQGGSIVFFGDIGMSEKMNAGHEWAITGFGNKAGACKQVWEFNSFLNRGSNNTKTGSWSSPALAKDSTGRWLLVFGTSNPDDAVYALDAVTGAEVWRFQTQMTGGDQDVGAGPTITSPGVNGISDGVVYIDGKDKIEYAIDLLTGTQIWSFDMQTDSGLTTNSVSTAALVGNNVVVGYAGFVYDFNATTGVKVWRSVAPIGTIFASPSISGAAGDQAGFLGDQTGDEYAFALSDGSQIFSFHVGHKILASTAISDGMVFFASGNGVLYALH